MTDIDLMVLSFIGVSISFAVTFTAINLFLDKR